MESIRYAGNESLSQIIPHLVASFFKVSINMGYLLYHVPDLKLIEIGEPAG